MNDTQRAIHAAFIALYRKQPFDKMSVKGLCLQAPVARTTFYSYYEHLGEVKEEIEDELISGILTIAQLKGDTVLQKDLTAFFTQTLRYVQDHWDENYAFLVSQPNLSYIAKWKAAIKAHFSLRIRDKQTMANYELILEVITSAVISAYAWWMEHPDEVDVPKLAEISVEMLSAAERIL